MIRLLLVIGALLVATSARASVTPWLLDDQIASLRVAVHPHARPAARTHVVTRAAVVAHTTALPVEHHRHGALRHRHALHTRAALTANRHPLSHAEPMPAAPRHPHSRHKATLPVLTHATRHAPGSRAGSRLAGIAPAGGSLLAVAVNDLGARQNITPDAREHPVTGGRGPPRGSPHGPPRPCFAPFPAVFRARHRSRHRAHRHAFTSARRRAAASAPACLPMASLTEVGCWPPPLRSPRGRGGVLLHALDRR